MNQNDFVSKVEKCIGNTDNYKDLDYKDLFNIDLFFL